MAWEDSPEQLLASSPQSVQAENKSAFPAGEKDYSNKKNYSRELWSWINGARIQQSL